jgi:hypothetical protein
MLKLTVNQQSGHSSLMFLIKWHFEINVSGHFTEMQINKRVLFLGCINDEHAARRQRTCLAHESAGH